MLKKHGEKCLSVKHLISVFIMVFISMHTGSDLEYLHAYKIVLKISAETGAKGRERKNQ